MQGIDLKYKANYYSILLLGFILPLFKEIIPISILLFIITSLINNRWKEIRLKNYKKSILWLTPIFFISLISIIYSENKGIGGMNLETKLSLLVFPVAFQFSKLDFKKTIAPVLRSFTEGAFVASVLVLIHAFLQYYYSADTSNLVYSKLSIFSHASYFSMYLCFGLAILYYYSFSPSKSFYLKPAISFFLIVFFTTIIIFLSSKSGWIILLIIHFSSLLYWIFKHKNFVKGGTSIVAIVTGTFLFYTFSPTMKTRVDELFYNLSGKAEGTPFSSTQSRILIWDISLDLIKEKPFFGYGSGDSKLALTKQYKNHNLGFLLDKQFNAHNQYLQSTLDGGLIAGVILLLMLFVPLVLCFKKKQNLYAIFIGILALNFFSEAMLETQSGVIFYAFFNTLFFSVLMQQNSKNPVISSNHFS